VFWPNFPCFQLLQDAGKHAETIHLRITPVLVRKDVDHLSETKAPVEERPVFFDVKPGMTVIVRCDYLMGKTKDNDWWMGGCICCEGGTRDPSINDLFQLEDVESSVIR
jgi:hypothetical protein